MSEINEDIKVSMAEVESSLGINLTAENTQIKHTGTGVVEFSSNGNILLKSGFTDDKEPFTNDLGDITLNSGSSNNGLAGNIYIRGGDSLENGIGGSVLITGGNSFVNEEFIPLNMNNTSESNLVPNNSSNLSNLNNNTKLLDRKNELLSKSQHSNKNLNLSGQLQNHLGEEEGPIGGGVVLIAGDKYTNDYGYPWLGTILMVAGQGLNSANGGDIVLFSGNSFDNGSGGNILIGAGSGSGDGLTALADGGDLLLVAGNPGDNSLGGDVIISGGYNSNNLNSRGGRVIIDSLMRLPIFETKPDRDSIEQAEGITGDIAFITGSQVLCLHDGEQWSNLPIPNTDTYFKYFKWEVTEISYTGISGDNAIQACEFKFTNNGVDLSMVGVTCTTNATNYVGGNSISNLIDDDVNTFWYSDIAALGQSVKVYFEFSTPVTTDGYRWATGPDAPQRDPVSWKVFGSNDNSNWVQLDELTNYSSFNNQTDRETYTVLRYDIDNRKELVSYNDDLALKALNGNDVNISCEPAITGPPGRINMLNVMRSVVFNNITERDAAINPALEGDICFVRDLGDEVNFQKLMVYTTYGWQVCN